MARGESQEKAAADQNDLRSQGARLKSEKTILEERRCGARSSSLGEINRQFVTKPAETEDRLEQDRTGRRGATRGRS
jgi:hypothetical protein